MTIAAINKTGKHKQEIRKSVDVWNDVYHVFPDRMRIDCGGDSTPHDYFSLFAIHYLMKSKEIEMAGEWISEKDIPGAGIN